MELVFQFGCAFLGSRDRRFNDRYDRIGDHRTPVTGLIRDSPLSFAAASNCGRTGSRFFSKSIESFVEMKIFTHRSLSKTDDLFTQSYRRIA